MTVRDEFETMDWPEKCGTLKAYVGLLVSMLERRPPTDESDARILREAKALTGPFTSIQRINADHMAQLRRDARSDDGTRAADAYATAAVLDDYARQKGR